VPHGARRPRAGRGPPVPFAAWKVQRSTGATATAEAATPRCAGSPRNIGHPSAPSASCATRKVQESAGIAHHCGGKTRHARPRRTRRRAPCTGFSSRAVRPRVRRPGPPRSGARARRGRQDAG
jgi:hypothetical protein